MDVGLARKWLAKRWFWIALLVMVVAGYQLGRDQALKENAADRIEARQR